MQKSFVTLLAIALAISLYFYYESGEIRRSGDQIEGLGSIGPAVSISGDVVDEPEAMLAEDHRSSPDRKSTNDLTIQASDEDGEIVSRQYDESDRLIKTVNEYGKIELFVYDRAGNLINRIDG